MSLPMIEQVRAAGMVNPIQEIRQLSEKFDFTTYSEAKMDAEACYVLGGTERPEAHEKTIKDIAEISGPGAGEQPSKLSKTKVYISMTDLIMRRIEILDDKDNAITRTDFKNIKLDIKFGDADYAYTPPPGALINDIEQIMKNAKAVKK